MGFNDFRCSYRSIYSILIGKNYEELGPRFPDMSEPYSHEMIKQALKIAERNNIKVSQGC